MVQVQHPVANDLTNDRLCHPHVCRVRRASSLIKACLVDTFTRVLFTFLTLLGDVLTSPKNLVNVLLQGFIQDERLRAVKNTYAPAKGNTRSWQKVVCLLDWVCCKMKLRYWVRV